MTSPAVDRVAGSHAEDYPARRRYAGAFARRYVARRAATAKWRREQRVVEAMIAALPAGSLVLDAPFGPGRFAEAYAQDGHRVCGFDISADMLREARAGAARVAGSRWLVQAEAEALPLRPGGVDYVVCTRFLNWLPADALGRVVPELLRVAGRGAIVQIRVARPVGLRERLRLLADPTRWTPGRLTARLWRLAPAWAGRRSAAGYVVHSAGAVEALLARHHASVEGVQTIGRRVLYLRGECHELRVYRLRTGSGGAPA